MGDGDGLTAIAACGGHRVACCRARDPPGTVSIQHRLDAIVRAMLEQREGKRGQAYEDLKAAIGMEERL
ncbi:hypothetical protein DR950_02825 [Kitasatospora xanthocidica]|uniref:Uncharacterized protein n=1 Tax=Kitasatospora xanthocidica TaxID=83382 RepID=A0A372ZNN5_9ACTN|nr:MULTISPECIES: hypothetical protein [Kitasatospora]RGD56865.1 hypothetical protein DR950_02825 [Kitasatospora xanthocidica]